MRPGVGSLLAEGLRRSLSNLIACGGAQSGGTSAHSGVTPSRSLLPSPWTPGSPLPLGSSSCRASMPRTLRPPSLLTPAPVPSSPKAPCPPCPFLTRNDRKPGFFSLSPFTGQILQHWLNFAYSSVFFQDLFFKPFALACRSSNAYIVDSGWLRAGHTGPLSTDQITPGS